MRQGKSVRTYLVIQAGVTSRSEVGSGMLHKELLQKESQERAPDVRLITSGNLKLEHHHAKLPKGRLQERRIYYSFV